MVPMFWRLLKASVNNFLQVLKCHSDKCSSSSTLPSYCIHCQQTEKTSIQGVYKGYSARTTVLWRSYHRVFGMHICKLWLWWGSEKDERVWRGKPSTLTDCLLMFHWFGKSQYMNFSTSAYYYSLGLVLKILNGCW